MSTEEAIDRALAVLRARPELVCATITVRTPTGDYFQASFAPPLSGVVRFRIGVVRFRKTSGGWVGASEPCVASRTSCTSDEGTEEAVDRALAVLRKKPELACAITVRTTTGDYFQAKVKPSDSGVPCGR